MRRILSIDPTPRGFVYAVVEIREGGEEFLVDWGEAHLLDKGVNGYRKRLKAMMRRYRPDVLVLPEAGVRKRGRRVKRVVAAMVEEAKRVGKAVRGPRSGVRSESNLRKKRRFQRGHFFR